MAEKCEIAKTWELTDKTKSRYEHLSTFPGRMYVTGDGSKNDQHIHDDIPTTTTGLAEDPILALTVVGHSIGITATMGSQMLPVNTPTKGHYMSRPGNRPEV